jgi:sugar fermentation stimulation protein A
MPTSLVGINTAIPNKLVASALKANKIQELSGFDRILSEVKYGKNSRIDLLLEKKEERCFIEIKNCTLMENGTAFFPDAVTSRGLKHLRELRGEVRKGNRAVMFYLVQRMDTEIFRPAHHIDPDYSQELKRAVKEGVEILAYDVLLDLKGLSLNKKLPISL